jgi:hypothetical protein
MLLIEDPVDRKGDLMTLLTPIQSSEADAPTRVAVFISGCNTQPLFLPQAIVGL